MAQKINRAAVSNRRAVAVHDNAAEIRRQLTKQCSRLVNRLLELTDSPDQTVALGAVKEAFNRLAGKAEAPVAAAQGVALIDALKAMRAQANALERLGEQPGSNAKVIEGSVTYEHSE